MKRIYLFVSLCLSLSVAVADTTLNIHQKSGGVVSYSFSDKPVVTYDNGNLHVSSDKVNIDYALSNLEKITFTEGATAIGEISSEGICEAFRIYDITGRLIKSSNASKGTTTLNIEDLPAGTYIVKQGETTTKIVKK